VIDQHTSKIQVESLGMRLVSDMGEILGKDEEEKKNKQQLMKLRAKWGRIKEKVDGVCIIGVEGIQ